MPMPISHIHRLYSWANIFVHLGMRDYVWLPIFALNYLKPLLTGGSYPGGSSVDAGIITTKGTIKSIQDGLRQHYDAKKEQLECWEPHQCDAKLVSNEKIETMESVQ